MTAKSLAPATRAGDPDRDACSCLGPGPVLAVTGIWRVNQKTKPLAFTFLFTQTFKKESLENVTKMTQAVFKAQDSSLRSCMCSEHSGVVFNAQGSSLRSCVCSEHSGVGTPWERPGREAVL